MENKNISTCGKYKLEIWKDDFSTNPFEDTDCEPDLRSYNRSYSEWAVESLYWTVYKALYNKPNLVRRHQKVIADLVEYDLDWANERRLTSDEKVDEIMSEITDDLNNEVLYKLAQIAKLPSMLHESRGYSQGDWSQVLIILTDEFFERTGCDRRKSKEIMDGTAKLYDNWAWGDVYGFTIYEREEFVKIPREEYNEGNFDNLEDEVEWKEVDSCGGFFGDNFETNGISEHIPSEYGLDEVLKNYSYEDIK
jgi:hypothetical protein